MVQLGECVVADEQGTSCEVERGGVVLVDVLNFFSVALQVEEASCCKK